MKKIVFSVAITLAVLIIVVAHYNKGFLEKGDSIATACALGWTMMK